MPMSQQVTNFLKIRKLKGIEDLSEIRFDEKPLTAILGPNGCGKSTILHALACCYKPIQENQLNWQFRKFFTPTTDSTWAGSSLDMIHSYREGAVTIENEITTFRKGGDRWSPKYSRRPERYVRFIGIKSCVPKIEDETYTSMINYQTSVHQDAQLIKEKLSQVFNRNYLELNVHLAHAGRRYAGLTLDGTRYSALAMGAGEQRVIEILSSVFKSPRYGLILIDEIDLLLHTAALGELINIVHARAVEKSLQVIFTTHREAVLEMTDKVSIKHIHTVRADVNRTYCFSNTKPDALRRLTGEHDRPLEIFVEDDTALAIVEYELFNQEMKRVANITQYGAATNCFTLAAGLILKGEHDAETQLYLLDGDLYLSQEEQMVRTNAVLTGTEENAIIRRQQCLNAIGKLCAFGDGGKTPEAQLHKMIKYLPFQQESALNEIIRIAQGVEAVDDNHNFINKIIETLNITRASGLSSIIQVAARSVHWPDYVLELRAWLVARRALYVEDLAEPLVA